MRLRKTNPGDLPQLKALWALGFGDTEQEIEAFFDYVERFKQNLAKCE